MSDLGTGAVRLAPMSDLGTGAVRLAPMSDLGTGAVRLTPMSDLGTGAVRLAPMFDVGTARNWCQSYGTSSNIGVSRTAPTKKPLILWLWSQNTCSPKSGFSIKWKDV
ncbi:MAG: hypothetical protein NT027_11990 [Proteobacteria bacterium]|nr:hypothetical protein [Pseudomonadota bacterium]